MLESECDLELIQALLSMQVLKLDSQMLELAEELKTEQSLLVFGRGYNYATALEAALKVRCPTESGAGFQGVKALWSEAQGDCTCDGRKIFQ